MQYWLCPVRFAVQAGTRLVNLSAASGAHGRTENGGGQRPTNSYATKRNGSDHPQGAQPARYEVNPRGESARLLRFVARRAQELTTRRLGVIIGCACACTLSRTDSALHFILRFRSSGGASPPLARKKHIRPRCRRNSETATFEPLWTSIPRLLTAF